MTNKTQMLKGLLEGCVLKVLDKEPCYSATIVQRLGELGLSDVSEGTLFPLLLRLENKGLLDIERVSNPLGASRKYYVINQRGREALCQFVAEWERLRTVIDTILGG